MNNWSEKKKLAIVEADDFQDRWDRNGLNFIFAWKAKYPKFKITLFTIPNRTSQIMLDLIYQHREWIELAVHGWDHESNYECWGWDYEKTKMFMERVEKYTNAYYMAKHYKKIFKAPGWMITGTPDGKGSGYKTSDHDAIYNDHQAVYKALTDMDYIIVDRHYNQTLRPDNSKVICIDDNPDIVHFHTWNVPSGDPNGRNGFQDVEERFGVPWDETTEFKFISEAWKEKLFKPCEK